MSRNGRGVRQARIVAAIGTLMLARIGWAAPRSECTVPAPGTFFEELEALCRNVRTTAAPPATYEITPPGTDDASAPPTEAKAVPAELEAFCGSSAAGKSPELPAWAALPETARRAKLAEIQAALGPAPDGAATTPAAPPSAQKPNAGSLVGVLALKLGPDATVSGGLLSNALVTELVSRACGAGGAPRELAVTCAPGRVTSLRSLREALATDLTALPRHALAAVGSTVDPAGTNTRALFVAIALFETLSETDSVARFAERLTRGPAEMARNALAVCPRELLVTGVPTGLSKLQADVRSEPLARAAWLLARVALERDALRRMTSLTEQATEGHLVRVALATLAEVEGVPAVHERVEQARALVSAVRAEAMARAALEREPTADRVADLGRAWLETARRALLLLAAGKPDDRILAPLRGLEQVTPLVQAVRSGDPLDIVRAAHDLTEATRPGSVPAGVWDALELGIEFARAKDDAARRRILARKALGLGAWSRPLLLDVAVGSLFVGNGGYRFAGELLAGYNGGSWGVAARGHSRAYDMSQGAVVDETIGGGATVEGFFATAPASSLRFDARLVAGAELYDTDTTEGDANAIFSSQTSILARATAFAGLRWGSGASAIGLWLGGGPQYEWYDPLVVTTDARVELVEDEQLRVQGQARLRAQVPLWSEVLVARLRADLSAYSLTRSVLSIETGGGGGANVSRTQETRTQLELRLRGFLDLEAARFLDLVPNLVGGFDSIQRRTQTGGVATLVPIFGAGIRGESF